MHTLELTVRVVVCSSLSLHFNCKARDDPKLRAYTPRELSKFFDVKGTLIVRVLRLVSMLLEKYTTWSMRSDCPLGLVLQACVFVHDRTHLGTLARVCPHYLARVCARWRSCSASGALTLGCAHSLFPIFLPSPPASPGAVL